jgi:hypothetical protein
MDAAGFEAVSSFNPYWNARGRSYQDPDGYRVVLEQDRAGSVEPWTNTMVQSACVTAAAMIAPQA